jgi:hypothetical protein
VFGTPIDPNFRPCANHLAVCRTDGADDATIAEEVKLFIARFESNGGFSNNWDANWVTWWSRWKSFRDKKAAETPKGAPRIEVNSKPDWDSLANRWMTLGSWPRAGAGGEPGMRSCICPPEILRKHGIDPVTGYKLRKAIVTASTDGPAPETGCRK